MLVRYLYYFPVYYFSLLLFAVGGLELCVVGLIASAWPASPRTERFFQALIHRHLRFLRAWSDWVGLVHVRYHDFPAHPPGPRIVVANHPAMTDIVWLLAELPGAVCIFKPAIRRNPLLGAAARRAGYLGNDGGHDLVRAAAAKVAAGHPLVIFPEGTRTPVGSTLLPFKAGFVVIARRARAPIQLVRITTDSDLLIKGRAWWRFPRLPMHVDLTAGPLLPAATPGTTLELSAAIETWFRTAAVAAPAPVPASPELPALTACLPLR